MSSTARFAKIVEQAGKPRLHVLWGAPGSDPDFQRAIKSQRVMTIRQENVGSKKDYGLIGFSQEAPAQFLVFPRSLKSFEGRRVVGINYELFDPSPPPGAAFKATETNAKKKAKTAKRIADAQSPAKADNPPCSAEAKPETSPSKAEIPVAPLSHRTDAAETLRSEVPAAKKKPTAEFDRGAVLDEVKRAMKELEAGKAVLVFRRLEKLAKNLDREK